MPSRGEARGAILELVRAVDRGLAVIDIDATGGAIRAHQAQPIGDRVEGDRGGGRRP